MHIYSEQGGIPPIMILGIDMSIFTHQIVKTFS